MKYVEARRCWWRWCIADQTYNCKHILTLFRHYLNLTSNEIQRGMKSGLHCSRNEKALLKLLPSAVLLLFPNFGFNSYTIHQINNTHHPYNHDSCNL